MKTLLSLKAQYKEATGKEWKAGQNITSAAAAKPAAAKPAATTAAVGGDASSLNEQITRQGDKIRDLKAAKASKVRQIYS